MDEEPITPLHDTLPCDVEDFDYEMHIFLCSILYDEE